MPPSPETIEPAEAAEEMAVHDEAMAESDRDTSGDFREPHPEEPTDSMHAGEFPPSPAEVSSDPVPENIAEAAPQIPPAPAPEPEPHRERARRPERPERSERPERQDRQERQPERPAYTENRRPEPRPWVKPADFRPAETSAISQAVAHATEIAESLKHTIDQLDEILELVELAERQKLADEREIDELRRALRRIQPPRQQLQQQRGPRHDGPRHDEPHRGHRTIISGMMSPGNSGMNLTKMSSGTKSLARRRPESRPPTWIETVSASWTSRKNNFNSRLNLPC